MYDDSLTNNLLVLIGQGVFVYVETVFIGRYVSVRNAVLTSF